MHEENNPNKIMYEQNWVYWIILCLDQLFVVIVFILILLHGKVMSALHVWTAPST